ncbi:c-type cytochrome, partial [Pseudorhodoferax sp. Leaf274]|uniref:c-type cytochrome n=1 Tax=Pseudorhodoferax sp. Leaf274 TaxID=1736318 RepID=UPI001F1B509C
VLRSRLLLVQFMLPSRHSPGWGYALQGSGATSERVQNCFRFSLDGFPPPLDAEEVRALAAYAQWRAKGKPVGEELPGRGFPTLTRTGSDPNRLRGKELYRQRCAACHAADGSGNRDSAGKWLGPPLWGLYSFNKGAGFQRGELLAGFIKANMPLNNANLSDQDAFDLAAWITDQWRKPDPRRGVLSGILGH